MRVIIEVDDQRDIERLASLLGSDELREEPIEVRRPSTSKRKELLDELFQHYRVQLPPNWKMDRDDLHRRDARSDSSRDAG
ncbi:MAG: hypothetical protein AAF970_14365 [Bacteroidota bacterium]